jgi:hypothetical protein
VAIRAADRKQNYTDLRARSKRHERWRTARVQRIVGLQRERHLHSFQPRVAPVTVLWPMDSAVSAPGEIGIAA